MSPRPGRPRHGARDELPIPEHPYRDTAVLHGSLAAVLVILALVTGADLPKAVAVALAYAVAAIAWSWWRFSRRIRAARAVAADEAAELNASGPDRS